MRTNVFVFNASFWASIRRRSYWWLFRWQPKILARFFSDNYAKILPYHPGEQDVKKVQQLLSPESIDLTPYLPSKEVAPFWSPPWFYHRLDRRSVEYIETGNVFIFPEGIQVSEWGISERPLMYPSEKRTLTPYYVLKKRLEVKRIIHTKQVLHLHNRWSYNNYFHWITETLTRYMLWLETTTDAQIPLVLPEQVPSFVLESIRVLHPTQNFILLPSDALLFAQKCSYVDQYYMSPPILKRLVQNIKNRLDQPKLESKPYRRLFISRKMANARRILNEDALAPILAKFNIEVICLENYSFEAQVQLCHEAHLLIGTHGAGLTNGIFMPEGSQVIEITTKDILQPPNLRYCYFSLISSMNLHYEAFLAQSNEEQELQADLWVSSESLEALLMQILTKDHVQYRLA
jgi:hypothetical protein